MFAKTRNQVQKSFVGLAVLALISMIGMNDAHANGGGAKKPVDGPIYVDFKSIVVPVIKKNGRTGVVALSVMGQVKDQKDQELVTQHMPRLRDAFIRALYGNMDDKKFTRQNGALDMEYIKERLLKTAGVVMKDKENPIKDILFQNIAQQSY
jgi:flagellar basal body-associated protein FliL